MPCEETKIYFSNDILIRPDDTLIRLGELLYRPDEII